MTNKIHVRLVDMSTGEVIHDNVLTKPFEVSPYKRSGEQYLKDFLECYLRGLKKYPRLSMSVETSPFEIPQHPSIF